MIWRILNILVMILLIPTIVVELILLPITMYILLGKNYFSGDPYIVQLSEFIKYKTL